VTLGSPSKVGRRPGEATLGSAGEAVSKLGERAVAAVPNAVAYEKFPLALTDHCSLRAVVFLRLIQRCGTNCI
jgi:hypothetical protein